MATETSSIDDVLASAHLPQAAYVEPEAQEPETDTQPDLYGNDEPEEAQEEPETEASQETDDYGNETVKQESKSYTEDEVNERINKAVRERLARLDKQPAQQQQQQQANKPEFEYNPESEQSWQTQLESFVEQTVTKMTSKREVVQQQEREQQAQAVFEEKFQNGMSKFRDFRDVVGAQPITDAMTAATRSMTDPAAFLYAASKRHAPDLVRIANLTDPYAQVLEMGRLEERMKKNRAVSSAPRPIARTRDDSSMTTHKSDKQPSIEDMIAASDAKRQSLLHAKYRR